MADVDAALGEELLDAPEAQGEPQGEPGTDRRLSARAEDGCASTDSRDHFASCGALRLA